MRRVAIAVCLLVIAAAGAAKTLNGFVLDDALVPKAQIKSGGPPRDGIPALFAPNFVAAHAADFLKPDDRVLGVSFDGMAKAYPIRILNYHEIVNDQFNGTPVAVTFCPLCGTGIVFRAEAGGQVRVFGVSGLLYNSDVLMYDRQSESLWSQIMGQAISGPAKGTKLSPLPARHTTWRDWQGRHPDTLVLKPPRAYGRNYNVDPYLGYAESDRIWFPVTNRDRRYRSKEVVIGVVVGESAKAYPFVELPTGHQRINDAINGRSISVEFDHAAQAGRVLDDSGHEIHSITAYWFAWAAFHPDTLVYTSQALPSR